MKLTHRFAKCNSESTAKLLYFLDKLENISDLSSIPNREIGGGPQGWKNQNPNKNSSKIDKTAQPKLTGSRLADLKRQKRERIRMKIEQEKMELLNRRAQDDVLKIKFTKQDDDKTDLAGQIDSDKGQIRNLGQWNYTGSIHIQKFIFNGFVFYDLV